MEVTLKGVEYVETTRLLIAFINSVVLNNDVMSLLLIPPDPYHSRELIHREILYRRRRFINHVEQ